MAITLSPEPVPCIAIQPPSANAGRRVTSPRGSWTTTVRSPRGKLYRWTAPGCTTPGRPIAASTALQSTAASAPAAMGTIRLVATVQPDAAAPTSAPSASMVIRVVRIGAQVTGNV